MKDDEGLKIIRYCLAGNIVLLLLKGAVGLMTGSNALKADAVNSAGDVMMSLAVLIALRYSLKPRDDGHHYGHGKMEALVSLAIGALILAGTGLLLRDAALAFIGNETPEPSFIALGAAAISILVKAVMYSKTNAAAKKLKSIAIAANAKDQRNDILVTSCTVIAILLAIVGRNLGVHALEHYSEPVLVALMSLFIIKVALGIISESASMLLDAAPKQEIVEGIRSAAARNDGVLGFDWLRCRKMGRGLLVDAAVRVGGSITVRDAHAIGDAVRAAVMSAHPEVIDVLVHINPD